MGIRWIWFTVLTCVFECAAVAAAPSDDGVLHLLSERCAGCHQGSEPAGGLNLDEVRDAQSLLSRPVLIHKLLRAIDTGAMPPETESPLPLDLRRQSAVQLRGLLQQASHVAPESAAIWRMNRFQYNNAVRDLFQLNRPVLSLPEKLMTRQSHWLVSDSDGRLAGQMPVEVEARCHSLNPQPGLAGVNAFPADLRAEHGFDNQADQLSMSPLLLDAFLRLSFSIVDSPDFHQESVGIWNQFFAALADGADLRQEISGRLERFLPRAFRRPISQEQLSRYVQYAYDRCMAGDSLTAAMKKTAAAILSSPAFLLHVRDTASQDAVQKSYGAASRLSQFLWSSVPDQQLLDAAGDGTLTKPDVQARQIDRLLGDIRIEGFLDTFPSQWLQLQNVLAATPDPARAPWFRVVPEQPASVQMILEPLLLFDAAFLENRPLRELINPEFSYRSRFLRTWYEGSLQPEPVDAALIQRENALRAKQRQEIAAEIVALRQQLQQLLGPVREQLLVQSGKVVPAGGLSDAEPLAAWEFTEDLRDSIRGLELQAQGEVRFEQGRVVLNGSWLQSQPLSVPLAAKSLEVRFLLQNLDQPGGGLMGIEGPGSVFDTIVLGERRPRYWISGSNSFTRTLDFPGDSAETIVGQELHLVMVYEADGTTRLYRNGVAWGAAYQKGSHVFPAAESRVLLGLRHMPAGGNRGLNVEISEARLYDVALTAEQVAAAATGRVANISAEALLAALTSEQREEAQRLRLAIGAAAEKLSAIAPDVSTEALQRQRLQEFTADLRQQVQDPVFRRTELTDQRYGGVIASAAMLSMTTGPDRTHPVARGAWISSVIFNDPPPPPPNDVPPLNEAAADKNLTIREQFAEHRRNPSCAGCHTRLDPLGFALENYDIVGRWRDRYENGREVDASGVLLRLHQFTGAVQFRRALQDEQDRIARAFVEHLLRFALVRPLQPADQLTIDGILQRTAADNYPLRSLVREVAVAVVEEELR